MRLSDIKQTLNLLTCPLSLEIPSDPVNITNHLFIKLRNQAFSNEYLQYMIKPDTKTLCPLSNVPINDPETNLAINTNNANNFIYYFMLAVYEWLHSNNHLESSQHQEIYNTVTEWLNRYQLNPNHLDCKTDLVQIKTKLNFLSQDNYIENLIQQINQQKITIQQSQDLFTQEKTNFCNQVSYINRPAYNSAKIKTDNAYLALKKSQAELLYLTDDLANIFNNNLKYPLSGEQILLLNKLDLNNKLDLTDKFEKLYLLTVTDIKDFSEILEIISPELEHIEENINNNNNNLELEHDLNSDNFEQYNNFIQNSLQKIEQIKEHIYPSKNKLRTNIITSKNKLELTEHDIQEFPYFIAIEKLNLKIAKLTSSLNNQTHKIKLLQNKIERKQHAKIIYDIYKTQIEQQNVDLLASFGIIRLKFTEISENLDNWRSNFNFENISNQLNSIKTKIAIFKTHVKNIKDNYNLLIAKLHEISANLWLAKLNSENTDNNQSLEDNKINSEAAHLFAESDLEHIELLHPITKHINLIIEYKNKIINKHEILIQLVKQKQQEKFKFECDRVQEELYQSQLQTCPDIHIKLEQLKEILSLHDDNLFSKAKELYLNIKRIHTLWHELKHEKINLLKTQAELLNIEPRKFSEYSYNLNQKLIQTTPNIDRLFEESIKKFKLIGAIHFKAQHEVYMVAAAEQFYHNNRELYLNIHNNLAKTEKNFETITNGFDNVTKNIIIKQIHQDLENIKKSLSKLKDEYKKLINYYEDYNLRRLSIVPKIKFSCPKLLDINTAIKAIEVQYKSAIRRVQHLNPNLYNLSSLHLLHFGFDYDDCMRELSGYDSDIEEKNDL